MKLGDHGVAVIEEHIDGSIFLQFEELDHELVKAGIDAPIDGSIIIPETVFGIVGEGNASALLTAFSISLQGATKHSSREQEEGFEALDEGGAGEAYPVVGFHESACRIGEK